MKKNKSIIKIIPILKNEKLSLTNNGELSFFWVGTGSAFSKKLFQTNLLIIKGNNHILVDCGTRCPMAIHTYGNSLININTLLITHSHADHIGGLEEIALLSRYILKKKPKMIITKDYEEKLWDFSLKGGCAFNESQKGNILKFNDLFEPIRPKKIISSPRYIYEINHENINVKMFRTMHIPDNSKSWKDSFNSYGIIIDDKVLFTSDTRFDPDLLNDLLKLYPNINCIFHDCQLFIGGVHVSYEELKKLPIGIRKIMYLTHYQDNYTDINAKKDGFAGFTQQGCYYIFQ